MQTPVTSPAARKRDLLRRKHGLGFREAPESLGEPLCAQGPWRGYVGDMGVTQGSMGFMSTMEIQMDKSSEHELETGAVDDL